MVVQTPVSQRKSSEDAIAFLLPGMVEGDRSFVWVVVAIAFKAV
ncbi:hypothetical protein [Nostoc sp.]